MTSFTVIEISSILIPNSVDAVGRGRFDAVAPLVPKAVVDVQTARKPASTTANLIE